MGVAYAFRGPGQDFLICRNMKEGEGYRIRELVDVLIEPSLFKPLALYIRPHSSLACFRDKIHRKTELTLVIALQWCQIPIWRIAHKERDTRYQLGSTPADLFEILRDLSKGHNQANLNSEQQSENHQSG